MPQPPQIVVENLVKHFTVSSGGFLRRQSRTVKALEGVSFTIAPGEVVGYIGPNGAGKSTTVKILSGILVPDSGTVLVSGRIPWRERQSHVAKIGVVFGQRSQLWWDLPVAESFALLREIYAVPEAQHAQTQAALVETLDIGSFLTTPVRQLSLGQRMRCELAASLLHRPEILFLDEPTIGLDAISKLAVREFVARLAREQGVTVLLTTHDMDDIEALCSRVLVIANGHVLSDGPLEALRQQVSRERWLVIETAQTLPPLPEGVAVLRTEGERITLGFDPERLAVAELIARLSQSMTIRDLFVQNPPIEEVIARFYQAPLPTAAP
ncbi:ABC transporter ATP-binding protein [Armatimonas rosea]|uniref:ABC-2 type transport system ATP-binding protein n=1 Tax=Armatimonas rosea TaxID=685828 RepID=A0A7W9SL53_ARMRO|nr:ATP-binding cassette domain-containing protein [Armatimonas rosea]MBB6048636.1 ABC-2 type transport system ATP-binding protein [Armatimonas rosea]